MQNRKRDTDVQNRLLDSVGEGEGGMFRENSIETWRYLYKLDYNLRVNVFMLIFLPEK